MTLLGIEPGTLGASDTYYLQLPSFFQSHNVQSYHTLQNFFTK